jgi:hypothetical protein
MTSAPKPRQRFSRGIRVQPPGRRRQDARVFAKDAPVRRPGRFFPCGWAKIRFGWELFVRLRNAALAPNFMTTHIDPLIIRKLDDFSQRRRKLIILRGICAAAATLLLAMMVVAVIDAIFVLPDWARWTLSAVAYLAVIVVEWRASLRLLMHAPGARRLARLVESAEPRLREDLLSAVELGETQAGEVRDSDQFRALVQADVAHRMEGMDMERLLPVNLVRRYIGLGIAAAIICIVAFVLSGMQFGTLMLRALVPGANLARVSRVQVRIVTPASPDKVVAQGETEPLVIEISGRRANAARLETITAGGREVLKMTPMDGDRFSATIQVGRDDVIYRVFAGDAVTRKFRLHAVARPHVVTFEKTFSFPKYVKREPLRLSEENGDLVALEGTEIDLRLATNQKVSDGELRVEQGKKSYTVKLTPDHGGLVAKLPLTASGSYRVHLVGADTGFENKFSPEYELRAEPDLVPQMELDEPKQDLILPANEIVDVRGTARDDQGLAKVAQWVRINEEKWREIPLAGESGQKVAVQRHWDLYEQGVKPGDLVTMKLVATDLKGSRAESRPLRVTITKSGFEPKRLGALEAQRQLYETLKALRTAGAELQKRGKEAREQFERLPEGDEQRRQVAITADAALVEFEPKATAAWAQLETTLRGAEAGHVSADLVQLGRALSRMNAGTAQVAKAALDATAADPLKPQARELMREFADACSKTEQRARQAEEWYRQLLFAEEFEVISENLNVVASEARRLGELVKGPGDKAQWTTIANRLRVILSESRSIDEIMDATAPHGQGDRVKWARKQTEEARVAVEKALAAGEPGPALTPVTLNFTRVADAVARNVLETYRDLAARAVNEHQEMVRDVQPTYVNFEKLREDLAKLASRKEWPDEMRRLLAERRWESRGLLLKQHGDLEEERAASDSYFVNDVRMTTLALDALHMAAGTASAEENKGKLLALDKSFRLLEAGHNLAEALDGLTQLATAEKWEIVTARARTGDPRDWRWLEARLRVLPDELGRIQPDAPVRPVVQEAQKILWEMQRLAGWQALNREMTERFNPQREPVSSLKDIEPLAIEVKKALDLLRKPMDEARQLVAAMAPKLHQMMADLAKKSEELNEKTEKQAQKAVENKPEQVQAEAQQTLAEQQKLNERIETLKDALRADANKQDILKDEGRERARDADDALAMLKEPPAKAEQALNEATQAADAAEKSDALKNAAQEQKKLAGALDQLAKHYENAEKGDPKESRTALRAAEEQLGIKDAMDQQFAKAEDLAKMAEQSPEELLKELEKALPKHPVMQQELSTISRNTLDEATAKLADASMREKQVAQDVQKLAAEQQAALAANTAPAAPPTPGATTQPQNPPAQSNAPNQPSSPPATQAAGQPAPTPPALPAPNAALTQAAQAQHPIAQAAESAGDDISRAGRHEQRLQKEKLGTMLESLGNRVKDTAKSDVPKAGEALAQAQQAAQAAPAVATANQNLQQHHGELQAAANAPETDAPASMKSPTPPSAAAPEAPSAPGQTPPTPPANASAPTEPGNAPQPSAQTAQAAPTPPAPGVPSMPQLPTAFGATPAAPPTPVEQMWMARTLDSLDAALHSEAPDNAEKGEGAQKAQSAQGQQQEQQPGKGQQQGAQPGQGKEMAQAKQAMNSAAQAAAAAMRAARGQKPAENSVDPTDDGPEQAVSRMGSKAQGDAKAYSKLGDARGKEGDWGKLPKKVAEQLTRGQNENVAGEYRNQVETYYRVIAEKSKKP